MTAIATNPAAIISNILQVQTWRSLASSVLAYNPDIVVLVARKMPRLAELLNLNFGEARLISDLAIPFSTEDIKAKRVAIVDDIVNVGSTLHSAYEKARTVGASQVKLFALAQREGPKSLGAAALSCADTKIYSHSEMRNLAQRVPEILRYTSKPYDLEFPIIPCQMMPPFLHSTELFTFLRSEFGRDAVYDISHPNSSEHGLFRYTIVMQGGTGANRKFRLYVDEKNNKCMLVPIYIPIDQSELIKIISTIPSLDRIHAQASSSLKMGNYADSVPGESAYRLQLFLASWSMGLLFLQDKLCDALGLVDGEPLSYVDAELLFGPRVSKVFEQLNVSEVLRTQDILFQETSLSNKYEYLHAFKANTPSIFCESFAKLVREEAGSSGIHDLFLEFFNQLANLTGAEDPGKYKLNWPYGIDDIKKEPYLRLRIGPTFEEIYGFFELLSFVHNDIPKPKREDISALLDWVIDEGTVVPAIANYSNICYRVYRKGESKSRDKAVDRLAYAISILPEDLSISRTRIAKILATLSYSARVPFTSFPGALPRGTVGVFPSNSIDDGETEITQYARNIGRITFHK